MKIKHYIHEDRFVIEVTPKDREEEEKVRKFIEWAELNAEMSVNNEKCRSKGERKMNKFQKELLEKCVHTKIDEELPLFDGIYILPMQRKHDSGYKILYIVGESVTEGKFYLLDTYCDVVNFGDLMKNLKEVNIDILQNGIIHCWSNCQLMRSNFRVSSCTFDFVDRKNWLTEGKF